MATQETLEQNGKCRLQRKDLTDGSSVFDLEVYIEGMWLVFAHAESFQAGAGAFIKMTEAEEIASGRVKG